jgi:MSHA biogenesis protein MshL
MSSKDGKQLVISRMTGIIQVRDYPDRLREVARFLEQMEATIQRQVFIEARFLEVRLFKEWRLVGTFLEVGPQVVPRVLY